MATYTETINTNLSFPNIDIYNQYNDGTQYGYRAYPQDGYVMYSLSTDVIEIEDPETGETTTEIYYCRMAGFPLNYNFDNFDYIAVLESDVPADHIFGDVKPKPEIMSESTETETM